jgi:antitoxin component YwqK of YwqJK toxin-antitoxin module
MIHFSRLLQKNVLTFSIAAFLIILLGECKPPVPKPVAGEGDLTGFELVNIPESTTQYASRKDGNGQMVIEGYAINNKRSGEWLEYSAEGKIILIDNYVDGLREGVSLKLSSRGQIDLMSRYHQGVLDGNWVSFKFGNVTEERKYVSGKLDGIVKIYDDRSWELKQEIQYNNGLQHGYYRYYDDKGNITLEYTYKNGEKVSGGIVEKK